MSIFGYIAKGFSIAKSSVSLLLTVFAFSFVWTLINLPFVSADGAAEPSAVTAILGVVFMLLSIFIQAGSIGYVEQVVKQGKAGLDVFVQAGTKNYLRMLGLGIVVGLVMLILAVLAVIGFVAGGELFIMMGDSDDRAGGVFMGVLIAFGSIVMATAAATFERILQNAVDMKSENDLTV